MSNNRINLDEHAIAYLVGELQNYCLIESERDVIADAFETFIGYSLKGEQGQFFTSRNVIKMMVEIVNPQPGELVIDPACGSGGFLVESLKHMWKILENQARELNWAELALNEEKIESVIESKWQAIEKIEKLKEEFGELTT